jgi:hypothetical protein
MLAATVNAAYWLDCSVPDAQRQLITDRFVAGLETEPLQDKLGATVAIFVWAAFSSSSLQVLDEQPAVLVSVFCSLASTPAHRPLPHGAGY